MVHVVLSAKKKVFSNLSIGQVGLACFSLKGFPIAFSLSANNIIYMYRAVSVTLPEDMNRIEWE